MLRLALLLAVPVAVVGEGIALRVSDFEVGADGMLPAEKCFGGGNEYCVPRLEGVCATDRWCGLLPESFFSTEQGTVVGRAGTIPIVSESADPEHSKGLGRTWKDSVPKRSHKDKILSTKIIDTIL